MNKIKLWIKENIFYIIFIVVVFAICNIKLPYYIMAPGGIISIDDRIKMEDKYKMKGTLNMLYASEYDATLATSLFTFFLKDWDMKKIDDVQISNESMKEIEIRNKVLLENSRQNAILVAYSKANKEIKINSSESIVVATIKENGLKIGDIVLKANGIEIKNILELKTIIDKCDDSINLLIKRDNKEMELNVPIEKKDDVKQIGIVIVTNYDYDIDPKIEINFKRSEGGSSGGLMMALNIYNALVKEDITYGHKIAGTGTINLDGSVGKIDGVKYKIMGANKNKMELVFVPKDNYDEAIRVAKKKKYKMKIVGVSTFDEALDYLNKNYK